MKTIVLVLSVLLSATALAQDYPASKPIRLIIPYGAGGLNDAVPRLIQPGLEQRLGQRIVIEHRPGAGGNVGTQAVVASPADGYTLLMAATNNLVINQFIFRDMKFDPLADLTPVSLVAEVPLLLQVNPSLGLRSLKDFVDHASANPGKLNYGSPSTATIPHLAMEIFAREAGLKMIHVPFKGGAPAATALVANDIQAMLIGFGTSAGFIRAGQVRALAVASESRLAALPDVPTFAEVGYGRVQAELPSNWWGMAAPKGTPSAIVERLSREIRAALEDPETRRKYQELGLIPIGSAPQEFAAGLPGQARKWEAVIRTLGPLTN